MMFCHASPSTGTRSMSRPRSPNLDRKTIRSAGRATDRNLRELSCRQVKGEEPAGGPVALRIVGDPEREADAIVLQFQGVSQCGRAQGHAREHSSHQHEQEAGSPKRPARGVSQRRARGAEKRRDTAGVSTRRPP